MKIIVYWDIFESLYFCEFAFLYKFAKILLREILVGMSDLSLINF